MSDKSDGAIDSAIKAFTVPILLVLGGITFIALGLAEGFAFGGNTIRIASTAARIGALTVGILLLVTAVVLELRGRSARLSSSRTSASLTTPAALLHRLDAKHADSFPELVAGAVRLDVVSRTAVNLLGAYEQELLELARGGCEIRLIMVDPTSEAARWVYSDNPELYRKNFDTAANHLTSICKLAKARVKVRLTKHPPTLGLLLIDRPDVASTFVQVQLYFLHAAHGRNRPVFRIPHGDTWFPFFRREFDELWSESVEWEPES